MLAYASDPCKYIAYLAEAKKQETNDMGLDSSDSETDSAELEVLQLDAARQDKAVLHGGLHRLGRIIPGDDDQPSLGENGVEDMEDLDIEYLGIS